MGDNSDKAKYDFFISFANDAKGWVYGVLVPKLGRTGKRFVLEGQELTGQFWLNDLQKNIEQSHIVLLILSPQYLTSERTELIKQMALLKVVEQRQWQVIPILLKSVERELVMRVIDGIDLTKNYENENRLNDLLGGQLPSLDEQAYLATPPYPGMQAFTEKEASWFFGREDEVDQYVKMLCDQQIVVLTGASGCGKSSLARAGIVPILEAKKQFVVKIIRPNDSGLDWLEQLASLLQRDSHLAKEFLFQKKSSAQKFLLLIDQFEELFTLDSDTVQQSFILNAKAKKILIVLADLKKMLPEFHLLLTLRAEFFPQLALCQSYINLDNYLQRVNALGGDGLRAAITKPALKKGVFIDERLVERLVNDAGDDPGILPFVQEVMRELWEKRIERYIDLEAYEYLGGKSGSGLKASIAAKADAAYKALTDTDKTNHKEKGEIAKRIFMRLLQFGEGKPDTRRQQSIAALCSDQDSVGVFEETLQHLSSERYRLLTVSREQNDEDSKVDIVHEALIKAWPKLQAWVKNHKAYEESIRELFYKYDEWVRLGKSERGALDKFELQEAIILTSSALFKELNEDRKILKYMDFSKKIIDPGWNNIGFSNLLLIFFIFISTIAIAISFVLNLNDFYIKFGIFIIFLISILIILIVLFSGKNKLFKFKNYSHELSSKRLFFYFLCIVLFNMSFFSVISLEKLKNRDFCVGSLKQAESKVKIAFFDKQGSFGYLNSFFIQIAGFLPKVDYEFINSNIYNKCSNYFDYIVIPNFFLEKEKLIVNIQNMKKNVNNDISISLSENNTCLDKTKIIYSILTAIHNMENLGVFLSESDSFNDKELSFCAAYDKNLEAVSAYEKKDFNYAEKLGLESIALMKGYSVAHHTLGKIYVEKRNYDKAIEYLYNAVDLSRNSLYLNSLASALHQKNMISLHPVFSSETEKLFNESLNINKNNVKTIFLMISMYLDFNLNKKAFSLLESVEKNIDFDKKDYTEENLENIYLISFFYRSRGFYFFNEKNYDAAIKNLRLANAYPTPFEAEVNYFLGKSYMFDNNVKAACDVWLVYVHIGREKDYLWSKRSEDLRAFESICLFDI